MKIIFLDIKGSHFDRPKCPANRIYQTVPGAWSCLDCGTVIQLGAINVFEEFPATVEGTPLISIKPDLGKFGKSSITEVMKAMVQVGGGRPWLAGSENILEDDGFDAPYDPDGPDEESDYNMDCEAASLADHDQNYGD